MTSRANGTSWTLFPRRVNGPVAILRMRVTYELRMKIQKIIEDTEMLVYLTYWTYEYNVMSRVLPSAA